MSANVAARGCYTPSDRPSTADHGERASAFAVASFPVPQGWDVKPDAAAVPSARRLIVDIARHWRVPLSEEALADVALCASELLANGMEHTKARCRVTVRWTGLRLRVEVADSSPHPPDPATAEDTVTGGRGLMVVAGVGLGAVRGWKGRLVRVRRRSTAWRQ